MIPFHESPPQGPTADRARAMQALIPVITTERLILRGPKIEDFQDFARIMATPQGKTYGNPKNREQAWAEFMQITGTWFLRGHGTWVITLRDSGATIGFSQIGAEPSDQAPELGYLLDGDFEGHGYASEAAAAIRDHGFGPMQLPELVSYIYRDNTRSRALATRLGAEERAPPPGWTHDDTLIYRHAPPMLDAPDTIDPQETDMPNDDQAARAADILVEHRASIDRLDAILVYTLGERFKHTQAVGKLKATHDLPPSDPAREATQIERLEDLARRADLDPEFAKKFLAFIIEEVICHHKQHQQ